MSIRITRKYTVTDSVLKKLYATENCYYCERYIEPDQRTIEHKYPLNRGGFHSIDNLTMACFSCNSSKRDLTEEEWTCR